jgi:hypothetical protein
MLSLAKGNAPIINESLIKSLNQQNLSCKTGRMPVLADAQLFFAHTNFEVGGPN